MPEPNWSLPDDTGAHTDDREDGTAAGGGGLDG